MTWVTPMTGVFALVIVVVLGCGWWITTGRLVATFDRPYPPEQSTPRRPEQSTPWRSDVEWDTKKFATGPENDEDIATDPLRSTLDPHREHAHGRHETQDR